MPNVVIEIDDVRHYLVDDTHSHTDCPNECSLFEYCNQMSSDTLCDIFSDKLSHFETDK